MKRFQFRKSARILKRDEFVRLSKHGQKFHSGHFFAMVGPGRSQQSRLGITVTKKVGHAVTRNRIKRIVREYFRHNRHQIQGIWDINVIAKKQAAAISTQIAVSSLKRIFDKLAKDHNN